MYNSLVRYYGAFSRQVRQRFWKSFEEWEVQSIANALSRMGITPDSMKSLDDVPPTLVYYMFSRATIFGNPFLLQIIAKPCRLESPTWPMDPLPPGYILLALHEENHVREWSLRHLEQARSSPKHAGMSRDQLRLAHKTFLIILLQRLSGDFPNDESYQYLDIAKAIASTFPFSSSLEDIWKSVLPISRVLSEEVITYFGLHRTILVHLHDVEPRMLPIDNMYSDNRFLLLLSRLRRSFARYGASHEEAWQEALG